MKISRRLNSVRNSRKREAGKTLQNTPDSQKMPDFPEDELVCGKDPIEREEVIARYLARTLDSEAAEEFEAHYFLCDECFEELRISESLVVGLKASSLVWHQTGGVSVLQFETDVELTCSTQELDELRRGILEQSDSRVIIDLSRVKRIDSAGLGQLMSCYSHLVRNRGALKILNPAPAVAKLMNMTGISTLIPVYRDEHEAVRSFRHEPLIRRKVAETVSGLRSLIQDADRQTHVA